MTDTAERPRLATAWLGGCSGCHMSLLDMDERLLELTQVANLVYGPFMDVKVFPENVDVTLVEGAIANEAHLDQIRRIRERTRILVALGDCAVTGNVTALRNPLGSATPVLHRVYLEDVLRPSLPDLPGIVPRLRDRVDPLDAHVRVDLHIPGCPPSAALILSTLRQLLTGSTCLPSSHAAFG